MKKRIVFTDVRDFLVLWAGQSVSSLGTAMTSYALILWSYQQLGTASSIAFLSAFTYLPSVFFAFIAGTLADRWDKKKIMILGDTFAAFCTLAVLLLHTTRALQTWHLYVINFILSCMNAFQNPAANVMISMLAPKEHYARANGLFALSGSVTSILTPAVATALFAFGGLFPVLVVDLCTFAVAISSLILMVRIPKEHQKPAKTDETFLQSCLYGIRYLRRHAAMLRIILVFALINLLANTGALSSALILARTNGNESILGMVNAAIGVGALIGSALVTLAPSAKSRTKTIFLSCTLVCLFFDIPFSLGQSRWIWIAAAVAGKLFIPIVNANLTAFMRVKVPIEMQGRVFSARDTLQCWTIPVGLFLGGALADYLFVPFMQGNSPVAQALTIPFGTGKGAGIALLMFATSMVTLIISILAYRNPVYRVLDDDEPAL